ncbi:MAG: c-type cytochrome [Casimicrobiaceae bacterium]
MKTLVMAWLAAAALGAAGTAPAADLKAGEAKVKEVCQACHGMDGNSQNAEYPKLGGQYPDYLAKALRDYKSGARKNPIMDAFAGTLSAADIDNLAAYYAAQPAVVATTH